MNGNITATNTLKDKALDMGQRMARSRAARLAYRYRQLFPLLSFSLGAASYFLVQRTPQLAQSLTALMLAGWVVLLFEGLLYRVLTRYLGELIPRAAIRFGAQSLHQETLFFVLPFFLITTTWASGQAVFTGLLIGAALVSAIDPIYLDRIATRRWLFLSYHGFTLFAALLAAGPIMLSLTTGQSAAIASSVVVVCALPSFADVLRPHRWTGWLLLAVLSAGMGAASWYARFWIPPATLHATRIAITANVDTQDRQPASNRHIVAASTLADTGLYAFSAIKAPRGLHQGVLHVWSHDGRVVDRIPLKIDGGGRKQGYRAWSHKQAFGPHPEGRWRVAVVTDDGQLIGARRFTVEGQ